MTDHRQNNRYLGGVEVARDVGSRVTVPKFAQSLQTFSDTPEMTDHHQNNRY